jgi:putative two-component system response regulator
MDEDVNGAESLLTDKPRVMVVDDTPENLSLLTSMLGEQGFSVLALPSGPLAIRAAQRIPPDLVLLDITMPVMDGYEVCRQFKADARLADVPIIFLSALSDASDKIEAFRAGGVDFISKPFQFEEVHARVTAHVKIRQLQRRLQYQNTNLQHHIDAKASQLADAHLATIFAIVRLSEYRHGDDVDHLQLIQRSCRDLAARLAQNSPYAAQVTPAFVDMIYHAAALHDVGKMAIPDAVLLKTDRLTDEEFAMIKRHTSIGVDTLRSIDAIHHNNAFLKMGIDIAGTHHERWDGAGYPAQLAGLQIPLAARIVAVVDAYDAMRSYRPYKETLSHEEAIAIIRAESGSHFDPVVADAFLAMAPALAAAWG